MTAIEYLEQELHDLKKQKNNLLETASSRGKTIEGGDTGAFIVALSEQIRKTALTLGLATGNVSKFNIDYQNNI